MEILRGMEVKITGVIHRLIFKKKKKKKKIFFFFFFFFGGGGGGAYLCKLLGGGGTAPPCPPIPTALKCIRRFGGIYAYCQYLKDQKW